MRHQWNLKCELCANYGSTVIDAFAKQHEAEINPGVEPFVSVPVKLSIAVTKQERAKKAQETLKAFGV